LRVAAVGCDLLSCCHGLPQLENRGRVWGWPAGWGCGGGVSALEGGARGRKLKLEAL
jgi:hypothetical protein